MRTQLVKQKETIPQVTIERDDENDVLEQIQQRPIEKPESRIEEVHKDIGDEDDDTEAIRITKVKHQPNHISHSAEPPHTRVKHEENPEEAVKPKEPNPTTDTTPNAISQGAPPASGRGANGKEKHQQEMKEKLERVKEDLSRYAVAYEAGRAESMNKDQKDKLEEKVRVMKELQTELEHDEKEAGYPEDEADESDVCKGPGVESGQ